MLKLYIYQYWNNATKLLLLNFTESFIVTMYGFLSVITAPLFFSSNSYLNSALFAFGTYFATYAVRPLGSFILGYISDRHHYKLALYASYLFLTIPTFLLCLLPTYNSWGLLSSFLLVILLMLQSIGAAASNIINVLLNEIKSSQKGKFGGLLYFYGFAGSLISIFTNILFNTLFNKIISWRYSFGIATLLGILSLYLLKKLPTHIQVKRNIFSINVLYRKIKKNLIPLLIAVGISINNFVPFCISIIYMNLIFDKYLMFGDVEILCNDFIFTFLWMVLIPIFGYICDWLNPNKLMYISNVLLVSLCFPSFVIFQYTHNIFIIYFIMLTLTIAGSAYVAPCAAFLSTLFPQEIRSTCVSFSYALGVTLFGAPTPFLATILLKTTNTYLIISLYVTVVSIVSIICLKQGNKILKNKLLSKQSNIYAETSCQNMS